jgi:branched-chain amino acid transport system ATP-binding protein
VESLESAYGRIQALKGVTLEVREGEIVCLVGGNGAGKTTLLRAVSGVQPVTGGAVRFAGEDVTHAPPHARVARGIAQVPEGRQIFGALSIADNLRLGA